LAPDHPQFAAEAGVVGAAHAVAAALKSEGFRAWPLGAREPAARIIGRLRRQKPDLVYNLIEGFGGQAGGEVWITSLLELMRLPYTGCPPAAQSLCLHKGRAKALLIGSGLPGPAGRVLGPDDPLPDLPPPFLVKPAAQDASLGIDQSSVITDRTALSAQIERVRAAHGPEVLVEAYLPGPEYNVGVIALPAPQALPVAEVLFDPEAGRWPILTYAAKWAVGSAEDLSSPVRCPAEIDASLSDRLQHLAVSAFRATGCRDYARVDFRLDTHGEPAILEVNPNPDLDPTAGLARALRAAGMDYGSTLAELARQALARGGRAGSV
jgi:D-alanine-D-alanine ligase